MNNLIVNFHPFLVKQDILIYQDGACVKQDHVTIEEVVDKVHEYCVKYDISVVNLCGNAEFVSRFSRNLHTRFENNNIEIQILSHNI